MTYPEPRFSAALGCFLTNALKLTYDVACSGWRTPYPQKRQQTLGATILALWKTAESYGFSKFAGDLSSNYSTLINFQPDACKPRITRPVAVSEHLIHRSANRDWGQLMLQQTSYPQKKPVENRRLDWLFFNLKAGGRESSGL
ncbi:hypothetical protein ACX3YC_05715 [Pseudomonas mohnii]